MKTKQTIRILLLAAAVLGMTGLALADVMAKIQGKCLDQSGQPMAGATIQLNNTDTGQKYELKTDSKGQYSSIGIIPGRYKVSLVQNGKVIFFLNNVPLQPTPDDSPVNVDFDLAKEAAKAGGAGGGGQASAQAQAQAAALQKQKAEVASLNQKLQQADALEQAGNWDQAATIMNEAATSSPTHPELWASLGKAELGAGSAAKEKTEASAHFDKAAGAYKKAVELKPTDGKYHNQLGQAYAKSGKPEQALAEYTAAAQADPTDAAIYYFNLGAILTNQSTKETKPDIKEKDIDEANKAFDKAIAAKPDYADAYYQKGINLMSKASIDKSGKIVAAPGTVEAFSKYLELQPTGPHVEEAKGIIAGLGETIQTSFKKKSSK